MPSAKVFGAVAPRQPNSVMNQPGSASTRGSSEKSHPSDPLSISFGSQSLPHLSLRGASPLSKILSELPHIPCPLHHSFCVAFALFLFLFCPGGGVGRGGGGGKTGLPFLSFPSLPCS